MVLLDHAHACVLSLWRCDFGRSFRHHTRVKIDCGKARSALQRSARRRLFLSATPRVARWCVPRRVWLFSPARKNALGIRISRKESLYGRWEDGVVLRSRGSHGHARASKTKHRLANAFGSACREMKLSRVCARVEPTTAESCTVGNTVLYCPLRGEESTPTHTAGAAGDTAEASADQSVYLEVTPDMEDLARVLVRRGWRRGRVQVFRPTGASILHLRTFFSLRYCRRRHRQRRSPPNQGFRVNFRLNWRDVSQKAQPTPGHYSAY